MERRRIHLRHSTIFQQWTSQRIWRGARSRQILRRPQHMEQIRRRHRHVNRQTCHHHNHANHNHADNHRRKIRGHSGRVESEEQAIAQWQGTRTIFQRPNRHLTGRRHCRRWLHLGALQSLQWSDTLYCPMPSHQKNMVSQACIIVRARQTA